MDEDKPITRLQTLDEPSTGEGGRGEGAQANRGTEPVRTDTESGQGDAKTQTGAGDISGKVGDLETYKESVSTKMIGIGPVKTDTESLQGSKIRNETRAAGGMAGDPDTYKETEIMTSQDETTREREEADVETFAPDLQPANDRNTQEGEKEGEGGTIKTVEGDRINLLQVEKKLVKTEASCKTAGKETMIGERGGEYTECTPAHTGANLGEINPLHVDHNADVEDDPGGESIGEGSEAGVDEKAAEPWNSLPPQQNLRPSLVESTKHCSDKLIESTHVDKQLEQSSSEIVDVSRVDMRSAEVEEGETKEVTDVTDVKTAVETDADADNNESALEGQCELDLAHFVFHHTDSTPEMMKAYKSTQETKEMMKAYKNTQETKPPGDSIVVQMMPDHDSYSSQLVEDGITDAGKTSSSNNGITKEGDTNSNVSVTHRESVIVQIPGEGKISSQLELNTTNSSSSSMTLHEPKGVSHSEIQEREEMAISLTKEANTAQMKGMGATNDCKSTLKKDQAKPGHRPWR
jgi:hypothetical protein